MLPVFFFYHRRHVFCSLHVCCLGVCASPNPGLTSKSVSVGVALALLPPERVRGDPDRASMPHCVCATHVNVGTRVPSLSGFSGCDGGN